MKKINFTLLLLLIIVFGIPLLATANPYVGADITLNGTNYSSISTPSDPCVCQPQNGCVWFENGNVIFTAWSDPCMWVEYTVDLSAGYWHIGLNAINHIFHLGDIGLGTDPNWYPQFELSNNKTNEIIKVPASDTVVNYGFFDFKAPSNGSYTVRLAWLNDKAEGTQGQPPRPILDANIKIISVFFDKYEKYQCTGFEPPMDKVVSVKKKNRVLPLKMELRDEYGAAITKFDIDAPPIVEVDFSSGGPSTDPEDTYLPAGLGDEGNKFTFTDEGKWQFNLQSKNFTGTGTYTIRPVSGDSGEYVIDPPCKATFVIE